MLCGVACDEPIFHGPSKRSNNFLEVGARRDLCYLRKQVFFERLQPPFINGREANRAARELFEVFQRIAPRCVTPVLCARKLLEELNEVYLLFKARNEAVRLALQLKLLLGAYAVGQPKRLLVRRFVLAEVAFQDERLPLW